MGRGVDEKGDDDTSFVDTTTDSDHGSEDMI